ncbi:RDD family protein [uncultured Halopseudomonas sp.]|uniref:RDD family protein n=1 Tax=uncultured Halopseudomonas sp. TaxID=2901193 RepID=UPI0030EF1BF8
MNYSRNTRFDSNGNPYQYVGALDKAAAFIIDCLVSAVLCLILVGMFWIARNGLFPGNIKTGSETWGTVVMAISSLGTALYFIGCWLAFSRTLGLKVMEAVIVDEHTQQKPRFWQFAIRYFGYALFLLPYYLGVFAFAWALVDKRKQSVHDKFARTTTVRFIGQIPNPL